MHAESPAAVAHGQGFAARTSCARHGKVADPAARWMVTLPRSALRLAERALDRGALSVRGFDRVLRVAWTLADLAGRSVPGADEVAEALGMRLQRVAA